MKIVVPPVNCGGVAESPDADNTTRARAKSNKIRIVMAISFPFISPRPHIYHSDIASDLPSRFARHLLPLQSQRIYLRLTTCSPMKTGRTLSPPRFEQSPFSLSSSCIGQRRCVLEQPHTFSAQDLGVERLIDGTIGRTLIPGPTRLVRQQGAATTAPGAPATG